MHIESLSLDNYRNYNSLRIELSEGCNIFYGENAQGKTNILEAVFLCAVGRSHRTSKDIDLLKIGENSFRILIDMQRENRRIELSYAFDASQGRKVSVNEIPQKRMADFIGRLNAVIFSPEEIMVLKQGPYERRRFFDMTMCQLKPSYFRDLQKYSHLLKQRNTLLKEIQDGKSSGQELPVWNEAFAEVGANIIKNRIEFIDRISKEIKLNHSNLTGGKEELNVTYEPSFFVDKGMRVKEIRAAFEAELERAKKREIVRGITLCGPQRDDYEFVLDGKSMKTYGSQGQQRTAVLAVKISEIRIIKEEIGENPILLLDDVMSELDAGRREHLFESLGQLQTIITCTEKETYDKAPDARLFKVVSGTVKREA